MTIIMKHNTAPLQGCACHQIIIVRYDDDNHNENILQKFICLIVGIFMTSTTIHMMITMIALMMMMTMISQEVVYVDDDDDKDNHLTGSRVCALPHHWHWSTSSLVPPVGCWWKTGPDDHHY